MRTFDDPIILNPHASAQLPLTPSHEKTGSCSEVTAVKGSRALGRGWKYGVSVWSCDAKMLVVPATWYWYSVWCSTAVPTSQKVPAVDSMKRPRPEYTVICVLELSSMS